MSDAADLADGYIALRLEESLRRIQVPSGCSASECEECGQGIPAARRAALPGVQTCIECQVVIEQSARHHKV